MKAFLVDINRCNGCFSCQIVCKDEHCQAAWLPYAAAQPETGQFWLRVNEKIRGSVPVVKVAYTPTFCAHCADAPCMAAAAAAGKPEAIYRREDGLVIIDPEAAKGVSGLVESCPIGAIYYNQELDLAQKCSGCAHLLDNGWQVPRCVDACSTDALRFGDESEFANELALAEPLPGLEQAGSRVYYLNLPKRFVAGLLVDLAADEVVIGATVELLDAQSGAVLSTAQSDDFGDFFFNQVEAKPYKLRIAAAGYQDLEQSADATLADIYLGVLEMQAD